MANIYLTEQSSILRKTGDRLIVEKDDEVLLDVQCHKIDAVLIFGNVQFTTQAVHELFEHGIEMAILTRRGRLIGQITSPATKNIELRLAQFRGFERPDFRLQLARNIISGKVQNCLSTMKAFSYNHPEIDLKADIQKVQVFSEAVSHTESIEQLLGIEGNAAKAYYQGLGRMILGDFVFNGRKKRPPPDPVNALLSFSYTLIFNEISSLLDGMGFDPYLGYLHKPDYGRPSLACDLIEEFRPIAGDRLTLNLINNRILSGDHFHSHSTGEGVYLTREGMKKFFIEYERFLTKEFSHPASGETVTLRRCFRLQAEMMARCIREGEEYLPLLLTVG
jgi:CRISPR-associated protein Cas1